MFCNTASQTDCLEGNPDRFLTIVGRALVKRSDDDSLLGKLNQTRSCMCKPQNAGAHSLPGYTTVRPAPN